MTDASKESPRKVRIAVIASLSELNKVVTQTFIDSLVSILNPHADRIFLVAAIPPSTTGEKIIPIQVKRWGDRENKFILLKLLHHILTDFKLSVRLLSLSRDFDIAIYHVKVYLLATLVTRLLRKRIAVFSFNSAGKSARVFFNNRSLIWDGAFPSSAFDILEKAVFTLANRIWIESKSVIDFSELSKYKDKISICGDGYINTERLNIHVRTQERDNTIGYIGRFEETKGILNLVKAVPLISAQRPDVQYCFGGGGSLWHRAVDKLKESVLPEKIKLLEWVSQNDLPHYLNQIKLFILPSETEGLPRAIMEAMACGAVVLATPVGGVPDLIQDGVTGFILSDNSPECIAKNVVRALEHQALDEIAQNARRLIQREYNYEAVIERCRAAIDNLLR
ncbi:MAG: hypothetical protein DRI01_06595 [Chloroflexi bacterium]|nr:MAG: hypothetical protein DRI01_06595 [Chloroflexota bacterium]